MGSTGYLRYDIMARTPIYFRYLKAVKAAKFLGMTIDHFLTLAETKEFPQRVFFGHGDRWNEQELMEWKNENSNRNK